MANEARALIIVVIPQNDIVLLPSVPVAICGTGISGPISVSVAGRRLNKLAPSQASESTWSHDSPWSNVSWVNGK